MKFRHLLLLLAILTVAIIAAPASETNTSPLAKLSRSILQRTEFISNS